VFRIGPLADSNFMARELKPFRIVACASPDYLRERGAPATPPDLETHVCLVHAPTSAPTVSDWRFVRGEEHYKIDVKHRLQVNDSKALLTAALDGFGMHSSLRILRAKACAPDVSPKCCPTTKHRHVPFT